MKAAIFPELARVGEHAAVHDLPVLSWYQKSKVCTWVRDMEAWKADPVGAPPAPPYCIFAGPVRPRWSPRRLLAAISLVLLAGCGEWGERIVCELPPDAAVDAGADAETAPHP